MEKKHYGAIDGLRVIACIGIVSMHVKANCSYDISGFIYNKVISSFADFVFLFMVISAFGMCCGYFDKVLENKISLESFYIKRYQKILPFFACLVLLDILLAPSKGSIIEGFADITLVFGLFPNNISVIGVGWFIGLVFAFYLIFPFFCILLKNKKRAWFIFAISLLLNYVCGSYFGVGRTNIVYSFCYFVAGGLIYLYRDKLKSFSEKYAWICLGFVAVAAAFYYLVGANTITMLSVSIFFLVYALGRTKGVLQNRLVKFLSSISMEVYLSHMVIFRIVEKIGLNKLIGNGWLQYIFTVVLTICGAVIFSTILKKIIEFVEKVVSQKVVQKS